MYEEDMLVNRRLYGHELLISMKDGTIYEDTTAEAEENGELFSIGKLKVSTRRNKEPFILHWNITEACNLRCTHCCVPKTPRYVSKEDAFKTIAFMKEKGFFLITLSGGECTIHPDFKEIYLELIRNGFYVNIFTNGTRFTPEIKDLFRQYKPRKVEVSVYGADAEDFKRTTQSSTGYEAFLDTLEFLKDAEIRTVVKAPITKKNVDNIPAFIELAKKYDADYKFGTFIFSRLDGDKEPLDDRLENVQSVAQEFSDELHRQGFAERAAEMGTKKNPLETKCSAMSNSFTLQADNSFSFCGMMVEPRFHFGFNEGDIPISKAFDCVVAYRDTVREMYEEGPCGGCKLANVCPGCPAHNLLENGNNSCSEYFKEGTICKLQYLDSCGELEDRQLWSEYL